MSHRFRPREARNRPPAPADRPTAYLYDPRRPGRPSQRELVVASLVLCPGAAADARGRGRGGPA